ncbi:YdeI/OmpD-associated family protein, partial [candidate division KSB1 bacterium]|nr:YdeI/OmpD-associated family protein [candidate division KSB1 bacterium]
WDKSPRPDISFEIPEEFECALQQNRKAQEFFQQLAPSYQKQYIGWIVVAKRPETREKRIKESIALLKKGEKLGMK